MRKVTKIWKTRDGTKLRICDMTDDHLRNTIIFLEHQATKLKYEIPYPNFRGEIAQYYAEQEWDFIQEADPEDIIPILSYLYMEKERRIDRCHKP